MTFQKAVGHRPGVPAGTPHPHEERAPGEVEQWWAGLPGALAAGTSLSWVAAGALLKLGSHQSPPLSAGLLGDSLGSSAFL